MQRSMELKAQVEKAMSEIQRDREELLDEFLQLHENAETQVNIADRRTRNSIFYESCNDTF